MKKRIPKTREKNISQSSIKEKTGSKQSEKEKESLEKKSMEKQVGQRHKKLIQFMTKKIE